VTKKYKKELNDMCKDYQKEMEEEIQYYLELGSFLLPLSLKLFQENIRVTDQYVDFLVVTKPFFEFKFRKIEFNEKKQHMLIQFAYQNDTFMNELRNIYSNKILDEAVLKEMKEKFDNMDLSKISLGSNQKILTMVPMGIIGSGKTFLLDNIIKKFAENKGFWGGSVSSDDQAKLTMIRMKNDPLVKKIKEDDSMEVVFSKSHKERQIDFDKITLDLYKSSESILKKRMEKSQVIPENLKKVKKELESKETEKQEVFVNEGEDSSADEDDATDSVYKNKQLVYIDKNHPLNPSFQYHLKKYRNFGKKSDIVMVGLIPQRLVEYDFTKWHFFDDKTIFICLHNVMSRQNHPSLNLPEAKRINIFLLFLQFFKRDTLLTSTMKNYVEYSMDFEVYHKKHVSEINLPGNEESKGLDRKFEKKDFELSTHLIKQLFEYKIQNDKTGKIKIVDKKIALTEVFINNLKKLEEYSQLIKLVRNAHIDYDSKQAEFANNFVSKMEKLFNKPDHMLKDWLQELKSFPLYIGLQCSVKKNETNEVLYNTSSSYKKEFKDFSKDFNIIRKYENKDFGLDLFNYTEQIHSTFLFFKSYTEKENIIIENFNEDVEMEVNVTHFIYSRGNIITFIVNKDKEFEDGIKKIQTPLQNQIQHITYAKGKGCKPFESNIILDQIYERLQERNQTIEDIEKVEKFQSIQLSNKKKITVYLVKLIVPQKIDCLSKKFFRR
jgi:hypothetical protein